ncbi:MAG: TlpA family protein disulfide reductase [Bacteroidetes bacterium]|nr:TlpA family protein disulfide reductase [Bacteroidota bacterium]
MRHTTTCLTVCALLLASLPMVAQNFETNPAKPVPGKNFIIVYNPKGTPLDGVRQFDAVAYLFEAGQTEPMALDIELMHEGEVLTGLVPATEKTLAVLFSFANLEQEKVDNNGEKGYKTLLYKADGEAPVPGAYGVKSLIYNGYGRYGSVKADPAKALELGKKELELYPASKADIRFYTNYTGLAAKQKDEAALAEVKSEIARLTANKKATEDDLRNAAQLAAAMGDIAQVESIGKTADAKFPDGLVAKTKLKEAFKAAKTVEEKAKVYNEAKLKFGKDKEMERFLNTWAGTIASDFARVDDWKSFDNYLSQVNDRTRAANNLNSLAWSFSGESLVGEAKNLKKGLELSQRSLKLVEQEMENPTSKPVSMSAKNWKYSLGYTYAMFADTYALLAYKSGSAADALKYQDIACEKNKFKDGEMAERYAIYFEKNNSPAETEKMLAGLMAEGKATSNMMEQHKRLFMANNTLESAYEKYVASLEKEAHAKMKEEVAKKMIETDAPGFALRNLKGEEVSLEGLRGKVLVVDFWATWCGPCKASFPAMQTAVNKFANRTDVEFLFIDTWEKAEDKVKNAADFIASKSYTFNVLMDEKDEVVAKFGVSGIPTKFVVDRNGKIRFKTVGFGGNDAELVEELSLMIEMAGGEEVQP